MTMAKLCEKEWLDRTILRYCNLPEGHVGDHVFPRINSQPEYLSVAQQIRLRVFHDLARRDHAFDGSDILRLAHVIEHGTSPEGGNR